ncbi:hypothetical protein [Clostridium sp.]|uniref:hypothetical protein n=1 Tax=Clostridium sp. TaxID=1506 RepID=UPI0034641978
MKEVEKYNLSDYIKKSINSKGEIVHYIGKNLKEKKDCINVKMLISGKEEKYIDLKLSRAKIYDYLETLVDETTYKDISILTFKKLQELYRHKGKLKIKNTMFLLVDSYYEYMDMDILGEIKTSNNIVPVGTRGFGEGFFINTRGYTLPNSKMLLTLYNHGDKQCETYFKPELYVDPHMVIERLKELCYRI